MYSFNLTEEHLPFLRDRIKEYKSGGFPLLLDDVLCSKFVLENLQQHENISAYKELYGEINWQDLTEELWYKQYISSFKPLLSFDKFGIIERHPEFNWSIYSQLISASLEIESSLKGDLFKSKAPVLFVIKNKFGHLSIDIGSSYNILYPLYLVREMMVLYVNIKKCQQNLFKQEHRLYLKHLLNQMRLKIEVFYNDFSKITNAMLFEKLATGDYASFDELDKMHISPSVKKQKLDLAKKKVDRAIQQNEIFKILYYENQ